MKKQFITIIILVIVVIAGMAEEKRVGILEGVNNPEMMVSDGLSLYVLDGIDIHQYRLEPLKKIRKFGKRGNGPGEFQSDFINKLRIGLSQDHLLVSNFNKIAYFTKSGQFIREIRLPFAASQITAVKNKLLITRFIEGEKGVNQMGVILYDQRLKAIKTLYTKPEISVQRSRQLSAPNEMVFTFFKRHIFIADQAELKIHVFDSNGNRIKTIAKVTQKRLVSNQYKKEVYQWFEDLWQSRFSQYAKSQNISKETMKKMIAFPTHFPAFRSISIHKNYFLVETYQKKKNKSLYIRMDLQGNELEKRWLTDAEPGRVKMMSKFTYTTIGNFYYYFKENIEDESWALFKTKLIN